MKGLSIQHSTTDAPKSSQPVLDDNLDRSHAGVNGVNGFNIHSHEVNSAVPLASASTIPAEAAPADIIDTVMTSEPEAPPPPDPAVIQPTSSIRNETEPSAESPPAKVEEPEPEPSLDLTSDSQLSNGLHSDHPPVKQSPTPDPGVPVADRMDTSTPTDPDVQISNLDLPHHPPVPTIENSLPEAPIAPAPSPATQTQTQLLEQDALAPPVMQDHDQMMVDAPLSPGKVSRGREDEEEIDEPAMKRMRAEDRGSQVPEFKVPDTPQELKVDTSVLPAPDVEALQPPPPRAETPDHAKPMTKAQQKFLSKSIANLKRSPHAHSFNAPVDPVALNIPTYPDIVKQPMDLKTIDEKVKARAYDTPKDFIEDFDLIVSNCIRFNGLAHGVTKSALALRATFDKQLANLPAHEFVEPGPGEKKAKRAAPIKPPTRRESRTSVGGAGRAVGAVIAKSPTAAGSPAGNGQTFALGPSGLPTIRRDSTVNDGRPRREIHPPAPKDLPYATQKPKRKKFQWELKFCQEIFNEFKKPKYNTITWPFAQPVDPVALNIPTYHKVIKKPMDLGTIGSKLEMGQYGDAKEFETDFRLVLGNCFKFNPPDHNIHILGKDLEHHFNEQWKRKKEWLDDNVPVSEPQSPASSHDEDGDDDDDEEEDDLEHSVVEERNLQINEIQKQIQGLSKVLESMQKTGTKVSPPVSSKKTKAKKGDKEKKKVPKKGEKKDGKKPSKKLTFVTYEQKQEISNRINTLPEAKMQTALNIIRDNMPNLKVRSEHCTMQSVHMVHLS